jgi:signal transduction histidine kinase
MPSSSSQQDVIGFTRIFVLFCTLVLLPALVLSSFGVIAILNESEADKQRRRDSADAVLQNAESSFGDILDKSDRAWIAAMESARTPDDAVARVRSDGHPVGPWLVVDAGGQALAGASVFLAGDALEAHLVRLANEVEQGQPVHAWVDDNRFTGVVSVQPLADKRVALYALDTVRLDGALAARVSKGDMKPLLRVSAASGAPVVNAVDRLMAEVERARAPTDGATEELVARRLEPPFDRITLAVEAPPSGASTKTIIAYIVLMIVFLSTLITGVVITARLIWQETRLSRLKTDFVSHMSHELRTPLTSIRMFIETLKLGRAQSDEERQECFDLLSKETERLSEMIERVLGYARLKAGRRLFNPRAVEPKKLIDDTIDAFRAHNLATTNGDKPQDSGAHAELTVTTDVEAGLPLVRADQEALVEALLNLVGNAYKYTGPKKEIAVFAKKGRGERVVFGVKDNGPGLPKHEHKRVFERFYQSNALLSSKKAGSGLGLAITKAIVEGNGGKVFVESEPGKGSTFFVELRAAPPTPPSA